ncbi:undecaprenyl-phosphate galactose phosphotransferase WbaP [Rodentibacter haemolyticus]|uniref:Undecaprenyl-phosphate galactose phosphotransferase WbaP n=1 Tax=Rodentibacter haemolyticus TaxID=2778911 RepID=A0ABX6V1F6_9PAST|nr:undecaprenyl-phosphate galactose phosphotransferase WbaP [Rodentibacter haemolyticus]QPB43156.1 undecaprenyl-phosphate galactose phosphotransferase WbaP [Rodentibacter haemolyticus]
MNNYTKNVLLNKFTLILGDFFSYIFAISVGYFISPLNDFSQDLLEIKGSLYRAGAFILSTIATIGVIWIIYRHYTYRKPFWEELKDIYFTLFVVAFVNLALLVFAKVPEPVETWVSVYSVLFICFPIFRFLCKKWLQLQGIWVVPSVIIGNGKNALRAYKAIKAEKNLGYQVQTFVTHKPIGICLKEVDFISESQFFQKIDRFQKIFIAFEYDENEQLEYWVKKLSKANFRNISIIPALQGVPLYGAEISHFFSSETIMLRIPNNLAKRSTRFIKRSFDIVISSLLLLLLSPVFAGLFLLICQDGGKVVYSQNRIGRNKKVFKCYKFRTMVTHSQQVLRELLERDPEAKRQWQKEFKLRNDPRITKIGKYLRKTSLDELPQLWNVLKGEMSLVGPRPVTRQELKYYGDDLTYYTMVCPGLSGLWQVSGRNDVDYSTRVYLDTWYVKNWSLWNDIVILIKTVNTVLKRDGAY